MVTAHIKGEGISVHIKLEDALDEKIVSMAIDMAKRREIKFLAPPKGVATPHETARPNEQGE